MIYLDACLAIYFVEEHPLWHDPVQSMLAGQTNIAVSPLVKTECLVRPIRKNDLVTERLFQDFFAKVVTLDMPEPVFLAAASIRARFNLKLPDALHVACAQHHGCAALWTNDARLSAAGGGQVRVLTPH